jgi:hypothetical protein
MKICYQTLAGNADSLPAAPTRQIDEVELAVFDVGQPALSPLMSLDCAREDCTAFQKSNNNFRTWAILTLRSLQ